LTLCTLFSRLWTFATSPSARGIANVFVLKGSTVILSFALITLAARGLGAEQFGTFSILFSAAGLLSIFASIGQQLLLMRSWNEYAAAGDAARLKGALLFGATAFAIGAAVMASGFFAVLCAFYPVALAATATFYMVALGLVLTTAHLVRTAAGVGIGDGLGNILSVLLPILYLAYCLVTGVEAEIKPIFWMFTLGATIAIAVHFIVLANKLRTLFPDFSAVRPHFEMRAWTTRSYKLWMSNGLEASNQYLDVLIIGFLMSPTIAGGYFVTTRLANAFATASDAMNMFSTRHIPDYYFRNEFRRLDQLLNSVAMITLAIIVGGMIVVLGGGQWLLMSFNEAYVPYYPALVLLCVGTAAVAAVGSSSSILMFTGHEGSYLKIIAASVALRAAGFFLLVPHFDVMGAVTATTISFLFMAGMLRHSAKRLTGIDGSIARLLPPLSGSAPRPAK
jgi:O-antigen/teichoic acid export membrane protein